MSADQKILLEMVDGYPAFITSSPAKFSRFAKGKMKGKWSFHECEIIFYTEGIPRLVFFTNNVHVSIPLSYIKALIETAESTLTGLEKVKS